MTPVTQYIVNISNNEELIINSTNVTQCPSHYGHYIVTVAANNTVGLGNVTHTNVNFILEGMANNYVDTKLYLKTEIDEYAIMYSSNGSFWDIDFTIKVSSIVILIIFLLIAEWLTFQSKSTKYYCVLN